MKINRELWLKEEFDDILSGVLDCPTCFRGTLSQKLNKLNSGESAATSKWHNHEDFDSSWVEERFSTTLLCSNKDCKESIAVLGSLRHEERIEYHDEDKDGFDHSYYDVIFLKPIFFFPELQIFKIPENCPEEIQNQIKLSFSHYFNDPSASANSMRTALELILNDQKINKTTINSKRKRVGIKLHARIDMFGKKMPDLKPFLHATKWIGNAGSHNTVVTKEDLLDGYELLNHCLTELYENHARLKGLELKAKSINKTKKPRSSKKKP